MSDLPLHPAGPPAPSGSGPAGSSGSPSAPTGPSEAPAARRRRAPILLLLLVLLVVSAGGAAVGLVAADQRGAAGDWRDRAVALEGQRDDLLTERDLLATQVEEALSALETSERDVAELQARVLELAEEKARAEDTATTVQVERDVFIELSELVSEATGSLDACVSQLFELQTASVEAFNRANLGQDVDVEALNARAGEVTRFCNEARTAAASAQAAADQLRRS